MADNVNITPGAGATIAADLVDGVYYQRVKLSVGGDGTAADYYLSLGTADTGFTGCVTVTGAGTAVQGSSVANTNGFMFKAHPANTSGSAVWLFPSGGSKAAAYPLDVGEAIYIPVTNLNQIWFDADVSGNKICWVKQ